jgi:hypothetical protein
MFEPLTESPYVGLKVDFCDNDKIWSSGTIISCEKRIVEGKNSTTKKRSRGGLEEERCDHIVAVAYDGWGPEWNERIIYPNSRIVRHFSYSRQVKALVDIQASRQKYSSSDGTTPMLLWPCRVQVRMPTPNDRHASHLLKLEEKVYVEPYLANDETILPEVLRIFPHCEQLQDEVKDSDAPVPGSWVSTSYIRPFRKFDFTIYSRHQLRNRFPLKGFFSSHEEALKDHTTPGNLPKHLFARGSLVNDRFLVKNSLGEKNFTGEFSVNPYQEADTAEYKSSDAARMDAPRGSKPKQYSFPRLSHMSMRSDSLDLSKKRLEDNGSPIRKKLKNRKLQPEGRSKDLIDERYEWQIMHDIRKFSPETVWTGVSPVERAMVECCEPSSDEDSSLIVFTIDKELEFLSICALYCQSVAERSLAIEVFHQANRYCTQNTDPSSSRESSCLTQIKNVLSAGGLELFNDWLVESAKCLQEDLKQISEDSNTDSGVAPLSRLLVPLLQFLKDIPVDADLVKKTGINGSIKSLHKLVNKQIKAFTVKSTLLDTLSALLSDLMDTWRAATEKNSIQNTSDLHCEKTPFELLIAQMTRHYEILCECEENEKSTPWDTQVKELSTPRPIALPYTGKSLIQQRREERQKLHVIEQKKTEETKKNMTQKLLGTLISKAASYNSVVKDKTLSKPRVQKKDNISAGAQQKKKAVSFSDEKTWEKITIGHETP